VGEIDSVFQSPGVVCKYYKDSCSDTWPTLIIDSRGLDLPPIGLLANGISFSRVQCKANWDAAELETGPETAVYHHAFSELIVPGKEKVARSASRDDSSASTPSINHLASGLPGDITICT
jgi:hypothetical protein